jgi:hypothetical protein
MLLFRDLKGGGDEKNNGALPRASALDIAPVTSGQLAQQTLKNPAETRAPRCSTALLPANATSLDYPD